MFGLFRRGKVPNVKNKKLISYRYSSGGDMCGGRKSTEISSIDGEMILTCADRTWWYEDENIIEYRLDREALSDIEGVFRKYMMQKWNQRKFTNMFVADGPGYSYTFKFEGNTTVSFSSQLYPLSYSKKLSKIQQVVTQCREKGTLEPGLMTREKTVEELQRKDRPDNGRVEIEVYEYSRGRIHFRISNGTDASVAVRNSVRLVRNRDGEVLYIDSSEDSIEVNANTAHEEMFCLSGRLAEGMYTLYVGEYSALFEISFKR